MLYYDKETETFWSQMTSRGIVGPLTGTQLRWLPSEVATWGDWKKRYPKTRILKPVPGETGYRASADGYDRYRAGGKHRYRIKLAIDARYKEMEPMTIVLGPAGKARGYPHSELVEGTTSDGDLRIAKRGIAVTVADKQGKRVASMTGYWFAWCQFYADGTLYKRKR